MATFELERVGAEPSVDWVGALNAVPFGEVLRRIAAEERSGDLQVNLGSGIKSVYFDRGFVVFAASNLKRDRLGESLIEAGRISRQEFALASTLMKGTKRKFGQALVQAGVMSEEELGREVALQVNRIVMSLFKVKDGIYSFDERGTSIPVELMVSLSIYRILLEGIRHMTSGKLILAGLPPSSTRFRVSERPPFTVEPGTLKAVEQTILKSAGEGSPLASLIRGAKAERGVALRACYGLYAAGLLEPVDETKRRPLKVQEETGVFVLSEIQRKFAKIQATNARQEVLMEFDRLDRATESELLAVDGSLEEAKVRKAYEARREQWEKKRALVEGQNTLVLKIDAIQERLQRAYEQVAANRGAEARSSRRPREPVLDTETEDALPPLNEDLIEEVGIDLTVSPAEAEASDDTQPGGRAPEPAEEAEEPRSDGDPSTAEFDVPQLDGEAEDAGSAVAPEGPRKLTGAAREERARQLLRDVKLHFQVRDWEHAVSLLYELVELDPEEARHHGMLARAMARHPVMRKDAERHFIEALRLSPQDADLHYSLGLYYKSFAMHSRAQNQFRTALRIAPGHEGALEHLSSADRNAKDPLRDMFKKIFG